MSKKGLNFLLASCWLPQGTNPVARGSPPWDVTNLHKQRFYHCVSPSLQRCHSNLVSTQTVWLFCHAAHSDIHSACREHRDTLLSTSSIQLYVQALDPDTQTWANSTPPPTSCHASLCPASPSLVALTFHTKVFASLAQRQLVNWQLGQASTFSSGVSVRVVWTWAWLDVQAHIGLVLVTGTAPSSKYLGDKVRGYALRCRYQHQGLLRSSEFAFGLKILFWQRPCNWGNSLGETHLDTLLEVVEDSGF